jgi:hypothetical protein
MAYDDEDDLFEEEFDFVDDDSELEESSDTAEDTDEDVEEGTEEKKPPKPKRRPVKASTSQDGEKRGPKKKAPAEEKEVSEDASEAESEAESEEPAEPPGPPADHVVHVYEFGDFKRTIQREFTDEDSIKFAEEFNRTSKPYSRRAVPVQRDEEPEPHL